MEWEGTSKSDISDFPRDAKEDAGHQLHLVQKGDDPVDWKPMGTVGQGVKEIRVRAEDGVYRIIYTATLGDAVYVLHAFQKKTPKTSQSDIALAKKRFKALKLKLQKVKTSKSKVGTSKSKAVTAKS